MTQCLAGLRTVFCALSETVLAIEMKLKQKRFFFKMSQKLCWKVAMVTYMSRSNIRPISALLSESFQEKCVSLRIYFISVSFQSHFPCERGLSRHVAVKATLTFEIERKWKRNETFVKWSWNDSQRSALIGWLCHVHHHDNLSESFQNHFRIISEQFLFHFSFV